MKLWKKKDFQNYNSGISDLISHPVEQEEKRSKVKWSRKLA